MRRTCDLRASLAPALVGLLAPLAPLVWLAWLTWLTTLAGLAACGGSRTDEISRLPSPAIGHMDETAQTHIKAQQEVVKRLDRAAAEPAELAAEVGELGRLYHGYSLSSAAEECYLVAEELAPADPRWPHLRGFLLQTRGDAEAAVQAYGKALENGPERIETLYRLAEAELSLDRPAEARDLFGRALSLEPDFAGAHYGLGRTALAVEDYEAAVEHLEEALELEPTATKIHHPLGLAYRGLGDLNQATAHLRRGGSVDVRLVDPVVAELTLLGQGSHSHLRRGLAALASGSTEAAVSELEAALEDDPDDVEARHNLAVALARAGRPDDAVVRYRELFGRDPDDASARLALGNLLANLGRIDEAIVEFREAVELAPDFKNARFNLGTALETQGRWKEALAQYEEVLTLDSEFASVRFYWAMAKARTGEPEVALSSLREQLKRDPLDVQVRIGLAELLMRQGEPTVALEVLRAGLAVPGLPSSRAARLYLKAGMILATQDRLERALAALERARELDPALLETSLVRAQVLLKARQYRDAAAEFGHVLAQRPGYIPARLGRAEALVQAGDCSGARRVLEEGRGVLEAVPREQAEQADHAEQALARALEQVRAACPAAS